MALIIAEKEFGHTPPPFDRDYVEALSIFATVRRPTAKNELSAAQRRRKRSLAVLHLTPDMGSILVMRIVLKYLNEQYNVHYDGRKNEFKHSFDNAKMCRLLGFMETVSRVFVARIIEMDMVLKSHNKKEIKVAHAIRDRGEFDPVHYEKGREEAYNLLVLAIPQKKKFRLFDEAEVAEVAENA